MISKLTTCKECPRLVVYREKIAKEKRKSYQNEPYWGKPVPGFGDPDARVLIVGLAPAAHGANRTGRIFTGDRSGDWLYKALHQAGFANQPNSTHREDGLTLHRAYVTCVVHCAPPDNKPTPEELTHCSKYLDAELQTLNQVQVYIALGQIAFQGLWRALKLPSPRPKFSHGAEIQIAPNRWILLSYHPSQQNTFTGRLTEPMFNGIFSKAKTLLGLN